MDDDVFDFTEQEQDLPDLDVLVWKLVRVLDPVQRDRLFSPRTPLTDSEHEYVVHALAAPCPECLGAGYFPTGLPGDAVECKTCKGRGR